MKEEKLVSVIIPCYNGEKTIRQAVLSIVNQTYRNLEIIICNDCSTDNSEKILKDLQAQDSRIALLNNGVNLKLPKTLNKMIDYAHGEYIARMDADDISLPSRIEKEVCFLDENQDYGIVGCNAWQVRNGRKCADSFLPLTNDDIQIYKAALSPFYHPTVMIRSQILKENHYNEDYVYAQDYELWLRLLQKTKGYNLKERLFLYSIEAAQNPEKKQIQNLNKARALYENKVDYFSFSTKNIKRLKARIPFCIQMFVRCRLFSFEVLVYIIYYKPAQFFMRHFSKLEEAT